MDRLLVDNSEIDYEVWGNAEPVLLISVSIIAAGLGWFLLAQ